MASSSNFLQLSILTATYRVSAVLPERVATNTTGPLSVTLNASNSWGQIFYLQNIGDLDVHTVTLSHTGPYGNGANRVDLAPELYHPGRGWLPHDYCTIPTQGSGFFLSICLSAYLCGKKITK